MALRVDTLKVGEHNRLNLGSRRLAFAGFSVGENVKAVIYHGFIKLYPQHAKLCKACGELVTLHPDPTSPEFCGECVARMGQAVDLSAIPPVPPEMPVNTNLSAG